MRKKLNLPTYSDINFYLNENKKFYIAFFLSLFFGIVIGMFVVFSNDSYLELATSNGRNLISVINGTTSVGSYFWKQLLSFVFPLIILFVLNLNFYVGLVSYVLVSYQSMLFVMSMSSVVSIYGISGILNVIFVMFPVNLLYLCLLIFFAVTCSKRSFDAMKYKYFGYGFGDDGFLIKLLIGFIGVIVLSILATIIYPLILKNAIFMIF